MLTVRLIIKLLPWVLSAVLAVLLGIFLYTSGAFTSQPDQTIITQNTILREVETMGKLELVRYNFRDITELEQKNDSWVYKFFKASNAKIALVSVGSATGCIDLTKIKKQDIKQIRDTVYVQLPEAELCYYKLDMDKTHIYSLYSEWQVDEKEFIQEGYRLAEQRIKDTALESGILEQTAQNAKLILKPLLEAIADKPVVFVKKPAGVELEERL